MIFLEEEAVGKDVGTPWLGGDTLVWWDSSWLGRKPGWGGDTLVSGDSRAGRAGSQAGLAQGPQAPLSLPWLWVVPHHPSSRGRAQL